MENAEEQKKQIEQLQAHIRSLETVNRELTRAVNGGRHAKTKA
jgi:hypothetical protein